MQLFATCMTKLQSWNQTCVVQISDNNWIFMRVHVWFFMLCKRGAAHACMSDSSQSVSCSQRELLSEILTRVCHDSCSLYSSHEISDFNNELNYQNNCRNFCGTQCNAFKLLSWLLIAHLSKYTSRTTVYNCKILILSIKSAHIVHAIWYAMVKLL